jgi:probable addiction module antidote protein
MLQDPEFAAMYLQEYLNEDPGFFYVALKYITDAYPGGISALSRSTHLNRESLYRALKKGGNPNLNTLTKVLDALGLRISVVPRSSVTADSATDFTSIENEDQGSGSAEVYPGEHAGAASA